MYRGIMLATDIVVDGADETIAEAAGNIGSSSSGLYTALAIILVIVCVALVVIILLQKERAAGLGTAIAGVGGVGSQTFWDKNKSRSKEGQLDFFTKILGLLFFVLVFAMGIIS